MKKIHGDDRGSGLITVIIASVFLIALGASLLFAAYTGFRVKTAQRSAGESFYDAEGAMALVKARVQDYVSDALGQAYELTLSRYSAIDARRGDTPLSDVLEADFQSNFSALLKESELFDGNGYDLSALSAPLSGLEGLELSGDGSVLTDVGSGSITLRGLSLRCTRAGYTGAVSTDITVYMPPFSGEERGYNVTGAVSAAIIADGALSCSAPNVGLIGDVSAGSANIAGTAGLEYSGGTFVSGGVLSIGGRLLNKGELWAGGISLGSGGVLESNGAVSVADDLSVDGMGAKISLSGSYAGFGFYTGDPYDDGAAGQSSAIVINARNTALDMSGLDSLILAGNSYISKNSTENVTVDSGSDILMGQSIAVRSDQRIYLVPEWLLSAGVESNPLVLGSGESAISAESLAAILQNVQRQYPGYNVKSIKTIYAHLSGGDHIVYLFMEFSSKDDANRFFADAFATVPDSARYTKLYLSAYQKAKTTLSSGDTYAAVTDTAAAIASALGGEDIRGYCLRLQTAFANLRSTLSPDKSGGGLSAFNYYVNSPSLPGGTTEFRDSDGRVRGVIARTDCSASAYPFANVIICTGSVKADREFKGLILASGNVSLTGSVTASQLASEALLAKDGSGNTLMSYLNGSIAKLGISGAKQAGESWELNSLVGYVNWKKD